LVPTYLPADPPQRIVFMPGYLWLGRLLASASFEDFDCRDMVAGHSISTGLQLHV
jgi:hypothetical protein